MAQPTTQGTPTLTTEPTSLLQSSIVEIYKLRKENQLMSARLQMFDNMKLLFTSRADYGVSGHSPDITFEIQRYLDQHGPDSPAQSV